MSGAISITDAASLAIHTALILAEEPDRWVQTTELADRMDTSRAHIAKVLQRLAKAGIVDSSRGSHGGFRLAGGPDEITLLDVYEAVEGPLVPPTCLLKKPICDGCCAVGGVIRRMNEELREQLASTSLTRLMEERLARTR